jgi:chemotaxis protein MotB
MRKKKHEGHVNHERWLVSYADFITLLFAFFVVMFAVSQVDGQKVGRFTESFKQAVGMPPLGGGIGEGVLPGAKDFVVSPPHGANEEAVPAEVEAVERKLKESNADGPFAGVKVIRRRNEIVLRLPEDLLYPSGSDTLKEPAVRALRAIAEKIRDLNVEVRVEGHTDNVPIHTLRFRSNWDLSTARATAVIEVLAGDGQIAPSRLAAAGYGEFHPIASNATPEERRANRRVDLVLSVAVVSGTQALAAAAASSPM